MTAQADTPSLEGSHVPLHRKASHRPKVLAAALGVGLTVSGVAYAAQAAHEVVSSAADPITVSSAPASPTSSGPTDNLSDRDASPSRSVTTRPAPRDKDAERPAERKERRQRRPKPSPSKPARTRASESSTPPAPAPSRSVTPDQAPTFAARSRTPKPTSNAPTSGTGILGGTNAARADAGLPALRASSCLARLAQRHAQRLAAAGTLYHQDLGNVMASCGMSTAGENVAMNYSRPSAMVEQWLNSPGHRANMLNRRFTLIGIGVAQARDGAWYGVQVFGDS